MLRFFLPIMTGTLLQQVYNMVDAVVISYCVGKEALAAVGGSDMVVIWLLVNAFVALSSGAGVIISQHYGSQDKRRLNHGVHTAIYLALICGTVITLLGVFFGPTLLRWLNTPEESLQYSLDYLFYYFLGMIPSMLYNMGSSILRAVGDSKRPLHYLMVCVVFNILLDVEFVAGLNMGVAGAAIATTISQLVSAALVLTALFRSKEDYQLHLSQLKLDKKELAAMLRIGLPAALQSMSFNICNVLLQSAINTLVPDNVAAWSAFWKIDGIYWPVSGAIGIAEMTFVGQNYGAGKKERIRQSILSGFVIHAAVSVLFGGIMILGRRLWIWLIVPDESVVEYGAEIIAYMCGTYITFSAVEAFSSALRGVGKSIVSTGMVMLGICGVRLTLMALLVFPHPSNFSICLCYPASWSVTSVIFFLHYRWSKWLDKLPLAERLPERVGF